MSDELEFEVGKRYRLTNWATDTWVEPIAIGEKMFFARNNSGEEGSFEKRSPRGKWVEVEIQPDIPDQFFNVYDEPALASRADADAAARPGRLGVVYVYSTRYSGDHAEFSRVKWEKPPEPEPKTK